MRIRGRRVVLLIAGALPLLAVDDDVSQQEAAATASVMQQQQRPQHEQLLQHEAEQPSSIIHNDADTVHGERLPSLLPLNLLQVESEIWGEREEGFARGSPKLQQVDEDNDEEKIAAQKDPPDKDREEGKHGEEEIIDSSDDVAINGASTASSAKEDNEEEEASPDNSATATASSSTVADAAEIGKEQEKGSLMTTTYSSDEDVGESDPTGKDAPSSNDQSDDEAIESFTGEEEATATTLINGTDIEKKQQQQQSPQVDQDEESSISDRVAVDYASKSAGALVLEKSPNFKGTSNLLNGDRDRYAISPCNEEKKFVALSLSEDIYVKQVKLANYELYSSRVKDFQIQISQTMGNWVDLGSYTLSPASGIQTIDLREPAWGRYLKFKFTSHYGDEFYCTLSQIMVHGSTMVQGFHEHLQESNDEEDNLVMGESSMDDAEAVVDVPEGASAVPATIGSVNGDGRSANDSIAQDTADDQDETTKDIADVESERQVDVADDSNAGEETEGGDSSTSSASAELTLAEDGDVGAKEEGVTQYDKEMGESEESTAVAGTAGPKNAFMGTRKDRNSSAALPIASVGVSSNVFSTIIGRLEPLHLKSVHRLSKIGNTFPHDILVKATDSTKAIKNALTDPAILEHLQVWNEANSPPLAFGLTDIGPREETLSEKLTAYIQDSDNNRIKKATSSPDTESDPVADTSLEEDESIVDDQSEQLVEEQNSLTQVAETPQEVAEEQHAETKSAGSASFENLHDTDLALANLLDKMPSIECLKGLDFVSFKEKALASRRGGHGNNGQAAAGHAAEPIFKMLTDQIKTLQSSLAVHDQFTKEAVQCYQRVLLDVVVELQTLRFNHDARLSKLEQDLQETRTVRWVFVVYQMLMGLPNWASLFIATFFTSYLSPSAIPKPLEMIQSFLGKQLSPFERFILRWALTVCIILLSAAATISFCQRLLSKVKLFGKKSSKEVGQPKPDATEDLECELTVQDAEGEICITPAVEPQSMRALHATGESAQKEPETGTRTPVGDGIGEQSILSSTDGSRKLLMSPSSVAAPPPACQTGSEETTDHEVKPKSGVNEDMPAETGYAEELGLVTEPKVRPNSSASAANDEVKSESDLKHDTPVLVSETEASQSSSASAASENDDGVKPESGWKQDSASEPSLEPET